MNLKFQFVIYHNKWRHDQNDNGYLNDLSTEKTCYVGKDRKNYGLLQHKFIEHSLSDECSE